METRELKLGPDVRVQLNHPTVLPVYKKVHNYAHHPKEGPPVVLLSGGSGARTLSQTMVQYTHNTSHVLPMFDDGGSSHELREKLGMPPPGDLRNRLMSLSDMSQSGNPEVSGLFRTRLAAQATDEELQQELDGYLTDNHPKMERVQRPYRRIIHSHLHRFNEAKPADFDLRGGSIGNFVMAGAYLHLGDLEAVVFEFSALAAALGQVLPVCTGQFYHLKADFEDGTSWVGQSRITTQPHAPIRRLTIVERRPNGEHCEVQPRLNSRASKAIRSSALVAYTMGSFYTSLVSNLLVDGMGQAIRQTRRPKVFVANLTETVETRGMNVSCLLKQLLRYLRLSDDEPGEMKDYVHYVLVGTHGNSDGQGRIPVDLPTIRELGVEPIELPLEQTDADGNRVHDPELVAGVLISLC